MLLPSSSPFQRLSLSVPTTKPLQDSTSSSLFMSATNDVSSSSLYPEIGDIVRYYELDGGKVDGQVCIGKIDRINSAEQVEVVPLENVGNGYYAEYFSSNAKGRPIKRALSTLSPIRDAPFSSNEYAYQIPMNEKNAIRVTAEKYDLDTYTGPPSLLEEDEDSAESYQGLKTTLLLQTASLSLVGLTLIVSGIVPNGDPLAFVCGSLAGLLYLLFLYVKTDTLGSSDEEYGSNLSTLRFFAPPLAFIGITLYNTVLGEELRFLNSVSTNQYLSAIVGFLLYRLPLFARQIGAVLDTTTLDEVSTMDKDTLLSLTNIPTNNNKVSVSLLEYLSQWSQQLEMDPKGMGLTTPVTISSLPNNNGIRILFQSTSTGYMSKKDEARLEKDKDLKEPTAASITKKEGGLDILLSSSSSSSSSSFSNDVGIQVKRCEVEEDTIIKEMSEETIVEELKKAIKVWNKK